jgi:rhodanese-related sulfurtransferase
LRKPVQATRLAARQSSTWTKHGYKENPVSQPKTVTPEEAAKLLEEGYSYIDVRSEPEFEAGHVPGALNVPVMNRAAMGMVPNEDFVSVMQRAFNPDDKLVVGCKAGGRSKRAIDLLNQAGFAQLVDMPAGWDGTRDPFGRAIPGWSKLDLPTETGAPEGQSYADVKQRSKA